MAMTVIPACALFAACALSGCSTTNTDLEPGEAFVSPSATLDRTLTVESQPRPIPADRRIWPEQVVTLPAGIAAHPDHLKPQVIRGREYDLAYPTAMSAMADPPAWSLTGSGAEIALTLTDGLIDALWLVPGGIRSAFVGPVASPEFVYERTRRDEWLATDINAERIQRLDAPRTSPPGGVINPGRPSPKSSSEQAAPPPEEDAAPPAAPETPTAPADRREPAPEGMPGMVREILPPDAEPGDPADPAPRP